MSCGGVGGVRDKISIVRVYLWVKSVAQRAGEKLVESNTRTEAKYASPAIELEAAAEAVTSSRAKAQGSPV